MKRSFRRRIITLISIICILFAVFCIPASANSVVYSYWRGLTHAGAMLTDGNCPIEVTHEKLTLNVPQFPAIEYGTVLQPEAESEMIAEYTLYNPTDEPVTARLVFPAGTRSDGKMEINSLLSGAHRAVSYANTLYGKAYGAFVNGAPVETKTRYTFGTALSDFNVRRDMRLLSDDPIADSFLSPDLPVTVCTYAASGLDPDEYPTAALTPATDRVICMSRLAEGSVLHIRKKTASWRLYDEIEFSVTVIGGTEKDVVPILCVDGIPSKPASGKIELKSAEETTYAEFAQSMIEYSHVSDITQTDWYNVFTAFLAARFPQGRFCTLADMTELFDLSPIRWYDYEVTVGAGETVVNTVKAPLFPDVDSEYEPDIFKYTYLLSPAALWADFGTLEIEINTPYYLIKSNQKGFEKAENGYRLTRDGLPKGELKITLAESADAKNPHAVFNVEKKVIIGGFVLGIFIALPAVAIIWTVRLFRKQKKSEDVGEGGFSQ
ncbi:MAG: hypothetical protein IJK23_06560 [Clostridia bacterium]|nr:hypothetical protein [Clostridia bacterium]